MLRNRTFLTALRRTPLRTSTVAASPPVSRVIARQPQYLRSHQLQQRTLSSTRTTAPTHFTPLLRWRPSIVRRTRNIRWNSNKPTIQENGNNTPQSVSQRFRELSRRYGYAAVGVYLGLSVIDFPFCFLAVRLVGSERIGEVEHAFIDTFWSFVGIVIPSMRPEDRTQNETPVEAEARETHPGDTNGHKQNEIASMYFSPTLKLDLLADDFSKGIWTQLLLAYGVHKSLIFFRVPLTAAVTPKVVRTLRSWGWNIGRPAKRVKSSTS